MNKTQALLLAALLMGSHAVAHESCCGSKSTTTTNVVNETPEAVVAVEPTSIPAAEAVAPETVAEDTKKTDVTPEVKEAANTDVTTDGTKTVEKTEEPATPVEEKSEAEIQAELDSFFKELSKMMQEEEKNQKNSETKASEPKAKK